MVLFVTLLFFDGETRRGDIEKALLQPDEMQAAAAGEPSEGGSSGGHDTLSARLAHVGSYTGSDSGGAGVGGTSGSFFGFSGGSALLSLGFTGGGGGGDTSRWLTSRVHTTTAASQRPTSATEPLVDAPRDSP
jgi:hypothetical protein